MAFTHLTEKCFLIQRKKDLQSRWRHLRHQRRVTTQTAANLTDSRARYEPGSEAYKFLSAQIEELKVAETQLETMVEAVKEELEEVKSEWATVKHMEEADKAASATAAG